MPRQDDILHMAAHAADPNMKTAKGMPIISAVIIDGDSDAHFKMLTQLADRGADLAARDVHGNLPMFFTVLYDRIGMFDFLMARGGDALINRQQDARSDDVSLLHIAASNARYDMAEKLLNAGAYANVNDSHGDSPLCDAIRKLDSAMMRVLVQGGAETTKFEQEYGTSLIGLALRAAQIRHHADETKLSQVISFLEDQGCAKPASEKEISSAPRIMNAA